MKKNLNIINRKSEMKVKVKVKGVKGARHQKVTG